MFYFPALIPGWPQWLHTMVQHMWAQKLKGNPIVLAGAPQKGSSASQTVCDESLFSLCLLHLSQCCLRGGHSHGTVCWQHRRVKHGTNPHCSTRDLGKGSLGGWRVMGKSWQEEDWRRERSPSGRKQHRSQNALRMLMCGRHPKQQREELTYEVRCPEFQAGPRVEHTRGRSKTLQWSLGT